MGSHLDWSIGVSVNLLQADTGQNPATTPDVHRGTVGRNPVRARVKTL